MTTLRAGTALGLLVFTVAQANAGGFAIREQSAYWQGTSFAGAAAGGALSSMFWNPATMTQVPGIQSESAVTWVLPYASHTPLAGSTMAGAPFNLPGAPNSAEDGFVPASYMSYQLNPNIWLGLAINAPFGLTVSFPDRWAGRNYAGDSTLKTYNATPTIAWRINSWLSVGAGVQIQYATASLASGLSTTPGLFAKIEGNGWSYGFVAGATFTPTPTTSIGIGYRSGMDQDIEGTLSTSIAPLGGTTAGTVNTTLRLPDTVTLGIRQSIGPQWTVMGTAEWSNWSRIGTATITAPGGPATIGGIAATLPFQYDDGWFFSVGSEYKWSERLTLRSGIGYEISPITDQVRTPRLPDNDRLWLSVGASWEIWRGFTADLAYSHLWVKDPSINISAASGNPWFNPAVPINYIGDVSAHVDILSIGIRYRWDTAVAAPAKAPLITK
jgi:long-chain fatty acid transport protein